TPAATTTRATTAGARERRLGAACAGRGLGARTPGDGVVGAPVISVGASAAAGGRGRAALRPFAGTPTGCSGHTAVANSAIVAKRSEEHTSELQSRGHLVCRLLLEKKKK